MNHWERVKTVTRAWPTWLVTAAMVAAVTADGLTRALGAESPVAVLALRVAAGLGAIVEIVRRSTPVRPEARGVLPNGEPLTESERILGDEVVRLAFKAGG